MPNSSTPSFIQKWKDRLRLRDIETRNLALDVGLLKGHRDYTRFIILGRSRTGSNLLRGLLASDPSVTIFSELFQNREEIVWGLPYYPTSGRVFEQFLNEPVRFIEEQVYRKVPQVTRAVGFKIFYYHAQSEPWKPVWDYLVKNRDIHVLHIKRRNMLRTHLSKVRAEQSGKWANISGEKDELHQVCLDFDQLVDDFTRTRQMERDGDILFKEHPNMEIIYEDLEGDYLNEFKKVQDFLSLENWPIAPQTYKQSRETSLSEAIENYTELKNRFQGSDWAGFFED
jgi:LPS sulfotransferase NodH